MYRKKEKIAIMSDEEYEEYDQYYNKELYVLKSINKESTLNENTKSQMVGNINLQKKSSLYHKLEFTHSMDIDENDMQISYKLYLNNVFIGDISKGDTYNNKTYKQFKSVIPGIRNQQAYTLEEIKNHIEENIKLIISVISVFE